jgi:hypothetical protein
MQRLEVGGVVQHIYMLLGDKGLNEKWNVKESCPCAWTLIYNTN